MGRLDALTSMPALSQRICEGDPKCLTKVYHSSSIRL